VLAPGDVMADVAAEVFYRDRQRHRNHQEAFDLLVQ
jgi:hypothetical protein